MLADDACISLFRGPCYVGEGQLADCMDEFLSRPFDSLSVVLREHHSDVMRTAVLERLAFEQRSIWIALTRTADEERSRITPSLGEQLDRVGALPDGWCGPGSARIASKLIADFKHVLSAAIHKLSLPPPFIFPQENGSLRAEWSAGSTEISIDADYPQFNLYMHAADLDSTGFTEEEIPLNADAETIHAVVAFLRPLFYTAMT